MTPIEWIIAISLGLGAVSSLIGRFWPSKASKVEWLTATAREVFDAVEALGNAGLLGGTGKRTAGHARALATAAAAGRKLTQKDIDYIDSLFSLYAEQRKKK